MAARLTQSFSFHQSPESFISNRLQQFALAASAGQETNDQANPIIRTEILDRNVHLVSSYRLCKAILRASEEVEDNREGLVRLERDDAPTASPVPSGTFAVRPAYGEVTVQ